MKLIMMDCFQVFAFELNLRQSTAVVSNIDRINNIDLQWDTQYDMTGDGKITVRKIDVDEYGNPVLSTNPDLWIQTPNEYGEKYCYEELDDLWQYFPTSCPKVGRCRLNR